MHLSAATIKENIDKPEYNMKDYYDLKTGFQSNLFHLYFVTLFNNIETGNRIFYVFYYILMVIVLYNLIRKTCGNIWFSLFAFLIIYNYNMIWGFTGYTISIPLVLLFCYILIHHYDHSIAWEILLSIISIFIFFVHFQSALFCILIFFVYIVYSYIDHRIFNIKGFLIVFIPIALLSISSYTLNTSIHDESLLTFFKEYYSGKYFTSFPERAANLFIIDNFWIERYALGKIWAILLFLVLTMPFIYSLIKKEYKKYWSDELKKLLLMLYVTLFCFIILPDDIPGQSMIYTRFPVYAIIYSLIAGSVISKEILSRKLVVYAVIIITIIHYIVIAQYFYDFGRKTEDFNPDIFPPQGTKEVTAALIYDSHYRGMPSFIHMHMYNLIWNKNVTTGLVDYRFFPVKRKTDMKVFPSYNAWVGLRNDYHGEYDNLKYILVKGELRHYLPNFEVIKESGSWRLYENKNYK